MTSRGTDSPGRFRILEFGLSTINMVPMMLTSKESPVIKQSSSCKVCGNNDVEELIRLPNLPLTDTFCRERKAAFPGDIDQSFLFCPQCRHGQVLNVVSPHILYGDRYHFRSSESATSRSGTEFFVDYLRSTFPEKKFSSVLDVGCNDLHLLKSLKQISGKRYGIDPIWAGREHEQSDNSVVVFGKPFEEMSSEELTELSPDLVVCRHSLEHIPDPRAMLRTLLAGSKENCVFLFEVPSLEVLVGKQRFDYIFHQHLHYFSLTSFLRLLEVVGGSYVSHAWNYHDWGGLLVAFRKKGQANATRISSSVTAETITQNYDFFKRQFQTSGELLDLFRDRLMYGYGAAQMLPVIAYHLKNDLSCLACILDDDSGKEGLQYENLPLNITFAQNVRDIEDSTVFITAIDNVKPIFRKLLKLNPKDIMYPLHIF